MKVPVRTLDDVLADSGVEQIDFVSLDLEGFEATALLALDLDRHHPGWLLVEVAGGGGRSTVEQVIGAHYEVVEELAPADVLYRRREGC